MASFLTRILGRIAVHVVQITSSDAVIGLIGRQRALAQGRGEASPRLIALNAISRPQMPDSLVVVHRRSWLRRVWLAE